MNLYPIQVIALSLGLAAATADAQMHHAGSNPLPQANNPLQQAVGFGTGYNNPLHQADGFGTGYNNPLTQGGSFAPGVNITGNQGIIGQGGPVILPGLGIVGGGGYYSPFNQGYGYNGYNYLPNQGFGYGGGYNFAAYQGNWNGNNGNGLIPNGTGGAMGTVPNNPSVSAVLNGTSVPSKRATRGKSSKSSQRTSRRR